MNFKTKVQDIDVFDIPTGPFENTEVSSGDCDITVHWSAIVETRDHCLKGVALIVKSVKGSIDINRWDIDGDDTDEEEITTENIDVDQTSDGWTIEVCGTEDLKLSDDVAPTKVDISLENKVIEVYFDW